MNQLKKIWPLFASAALVGVLLLSGCSHRQTASAGQGATLQVGFISAGSKIPNGPEGWADRKGLLLPALRPLGITQVEFTSFPNGPDLNEALAGGALDAGLVGDTPAIVAHAAGQPTRLINQSSVGTNCWLMTRADGPKTVEELKGKTVATSKGSYMARYLLGLLQEKGLTNSVKFVHLLPTDSEAALRRGDIAAYASPYGPLLVQHGFRVIDEAKNHPGLSGSGVTVVAATYLAAHPTFPGVWNQARASSIADLQKHLDEFYRFQADAIHLPLNVVRVLYPAKLYNPEPLTPNGVALLNGTKAFLVQQHLAKTDFAVSDWAVPSESRLAQSH